MADKQGSSPKIGRAKRPGQSAKRKKYRDYVYPVHKMRAVLRGNGYEAALAYATTHLWVSVLNKLVAKKTLPAYCLPPDRRPKAIQSDRQGGD